MTSTDNHKPKRRGCWRGLAIAAITLGLGFLAAELVLRWILFTPEREFGSLGKTLRKAGLYGLDGVEQDYWKLQHLLLDPKARTARPPPDDVLGWVGYSIQTGTYAHPDEKHLGERRPVLLYGDSYAACNTPPEQCYQTILAMGPLGRELALINYGMGGYGVDQSVLLLEQSLPRFEDRDPIVLLSIFLDDDLNRTILSFRSWPKPRFVLAGAGLEYVPPGIPDPDEYLAQHPPEVTSYVWRLLFHNPGFVPRRVRRLYEHDQHAEEKLELSRRLIDRALSLLEARGIRHAVWIFHGKLVYQKPDEPFAPELVVREVCAKHGTTVLSTRPFLDAYLDGDLERLKDLFGQSGKLLGHYTPIGNVLAFEPVRQWLDGAVGEPHDATRVLKEIRTGLYGAFMEASYSRQLFGREVRVFKRSNEFVVYAEVKDAPDDVLVRPGDSGESRVEIPLGEGERMFRATLSTAAPDVALATGTELRVTIRRDRDVVHELYFDVDSPPVELAIELAGARSLTVTIESLAGQPLARWVRFSAARFE